MRIILISKKNLIISALIILILIALIITLITMEKKASQTVSTNIIVEAYELEVSTANKRELPVYSVARDDKKIALTIDAAWDDDKTDFILETLDKYNIKATFYLCGFWAKKYPDKVKAIDAAGHELGNHSATHPHMNQLSSSQIQKELKTFDDLLEGIIGKRAKTFRAPYGEYNDNVIKTVRGMGYEVVQWNIDTIDWKPERSTQTILNTVLPKLESGSIILCHNNGYKIEEYLPPLIEEALSREYEFVTISELLLEGNTIIDVNGVQKPAQ
jgi:polysaccharide deacetylase family sporulation protein PdaB